MLFSSSGKAVRFNESDVRPMGRTATGVRGMLLDIGQTVISMLGAEDEQQSVLTATENGYGKRTPIVEYTRHGRGTKGTIAIQQSERNGNVVAAALVHPDDEVMLISTGGVLIRTSAKSIREMSRSTQGVTLINLSEGETLAGIARVVGGKRMSLGAVHFSSRCSKLSAGRALRQRRDRRQNSTRGQSGMNRKRLIFAIAATLFAPVIASAQSTMVMYGRLYPQLVHARTSNATAPGTGVATMQANPSAENERVLAMEPNNSRLGFRGAEQLGTGLKVIWQIEQSIDIDRGGGSLASRDTFLGLQSETWGTVKLGLLDTVYKEIGDTLSFIGVGSGNFVAVNNVLAKSNLSDTGAASFHVRRENSVVYESPERSGFMFLVQYSPDEQKSATRNADLWSLGATYENGPLYLALAYERHNDFFGGSRSSRSSVRNNNDPNARSRDESVRLTAQYEFGSHTLQGNYARLRYKETGGQHGRFAKYESDHWSLNWEANWPGPWRAAIAYSGANDGSCSLLGGVPCTTDGLDGHMFAVGSGYDLSRRTMLFALAAYLDNGKSALFNNAGSVEPAVGASTTHIAVGLLHQF